MARTKSTPSKATYLPNKEDSSLPEDDSSCESLFSRDEEEGVEEGEEEEEEAEEEEGEEAEGLRPKRNSEYFEEYLALQKSKDGLEELQKENRRLEMEKCRRQEERYRVKTVIRDRADVSLLLTLVTIS